MVSINLSPFEAKPNHFSYSDTTLPLKTIPDSARGANRCKYYLHIQTARFCSVHFSDRVLVLYPANYGLLNHRKKPMCTHTGEKDFNIHVTKIFNPVSASLGSHVHYRNPLTSQSSHSTLNRLTFFSRRDLQMYTYAHLTAFGNFF